MISGATVNVIVLQVLYLGLQCPQQPCTVETPS